jgi:hypothetical protein
MCCFGCAWKYRVARITIHPAVDLQTIHQRGGAGSRKRWWRNNLRDTDTPSISDNSSEITRRYPFQKLHRRLSNLDQGGFNELRGDFNQSTTVFVLRDDAQESLTCENPLSAEQCPQPTKMWTDEEDANSTTTEKGSLKDVAMVKPVHGKARTTNPCQGSSNRLHSTETLRVPYIFEFVPFPGHTCTGRGKIPPGTVVVSVDLNTGNPSSFKYNTSFQVSSTNINAEILFLQTILLSCAMSQELLSETQWNPVPQCGLREK